MPNDFEAKRSCSICQAASFPYNVKVNKRKEIKRSSVASNSGVGIFK
ncbi:hypothetical protein PB1_09297 [Bacillus methanolicus PB1]|uniref:Uncharacterized protein n=1 Tax=Bacillus methanolicus PB1 TaxID=997296 RepID=I3E224_BACMT|nr:hypothetical protein PB1_09297 [Bacillus methanolicus PB1]